MGVPAANTGNERGFGMVDVLAGLGRMLIGIAGMLAMQSVTMQGTRSAQRLSRASQLAAETMELLREQTVGNVREKQGPYGTPQATAGVTCARRYTAVQLPTSPNLVLVTVQVTFDDPHPLGDVVVRPPAMRDPEAGFTMVETTVSAVLAAISAGFIFGIHSKLSVVQRDATALTEAQQVLRAGLDYVARDVRNAGFGTSAFGTAASNPPNVDLRAVSIDNNAYDSGPDLLRVFYGDATVMAPVSRTGPRWDPAVTQLDVADLQLALRVFEPASTLDRDTDGDAARNWYSAENMDDPQLLLGANDLVQLRLALVTKAISSVPVGANELPMLHNPDRPLANNDVSDADVASIQSRLNSASSPYHGGNLFRYATMVVDLRNMGRGN
jgi:Tfp pilus assembly protein PilV